MNITIHVHRLEILLNSLVRLIRAGQVEDILNSGMKIAGDLPGQRQGGIKLSCLNGLDGLTSDPYMMGKGFLGEIMHGSVNLYPVFHHAHSPYCFL